MSPGEPLKPALPVQFTGPSGVPSPPIHALLDSGADCSSFPVGLAKSLGYDLSDCQQLIGMTAGGQAASYLHAQPVQARLMGRTLALRAYFQPSLPVVLLGRDDFFAVFEIAFDQKAKTFTLKPY